MKSKSNVTTLKLEKETKERLEKLREHKRETYDDIIRKIMYVLNTVRDEPSKAKAILEFIDEKRKRMFETSFSASTNEKNKRRAEREQSFEASKTSHPQKSGRTQSKKERDIEQEKNKEKRK